MPWETSAGGLLPTEDWIPVKTPPYPWQTVPYPATPPPGNWGWWVYPKDTWPYQPTPWERKVLGAFTPRKVIMREDIGAPLKDPPGPWPSPEIWPTVTYPKPAGLAHVDTRPDGIWGRTKSVQTIKVHMRPDVWLDISPHPSLWARAKLEAALQEMSRKRPLRLETEDGSITIKSMRSINWSQHRKEYQKRKAKAQLEFR
jgi:hypothetical protein